MTDFRIGQGWDVHPLVKGRPLILGGVTIPSDFGLDGHSDADCLCHALMDALLGACGKDDIGKRFPSSDARYKGISSLNLLENVWREISSDGWGIVNFNCYLLAQAPKLSPFFGEMKRRICEVLGCDASRCAIHATTAEGLGFVGRGEGMASNAVVLLSR